jgi:hypothetical protein
VPRSLFESNSTCPKAEQPALGKRKRDATYASDAARVVLLCAPAHGKANDYLDLCRPLVGIDYAALTLVLVHHGNPEQAHPMRRSNDVDESENKCDCRFGFYVIACVRSHVRSQYAHPYIFARNRHRSSNIKFIILLTRARVPSLSESSYHLLASY